MFNVKKTVSNCPVFTHAIRKANKVITHTDAAGVLLIVDGPEARKMTMGQLVGLSVGPELGM
ncbi:hypothetical protein ETR_00595 [Erwinia tracheiphila PSU-1]|nr:hypothetical protein ETR_00595 [Erwinia tracheiphila PSU-1]